MTTGNHGFVRVQRQTAIVSYTCRMILCRFAHTADTFRAVHIFERIKGV